MAFLVSVFFLRLMLTNEYGHKNNTDTEHEDGC